MREEPKDLLDSKISLHDRHRFEVKLDVLLAQERTLGAYEVEAFFFIPKSLGLNPRTYPSDAFYGDVQNYLRFKTPNIGLAKLADDGYEFSPFKRLRSFLDRILEGDVSERWVEKSVHELKLLGCVLRADVRDHVHSLLKEARRLRGRPGVEPQRRDLEEAGLRFLKELGALMRRLRSLKAALSDPGLPDGVREAYQRLDEFASLSVESYLTIFLMEAAQSGGPELPALERGIRETLAAEQGHRAAMEYPSVVAPGTDNEAFAQRRSLLKKYVSSLLFLEIEVSEASPLRELLFSAAAGVAMLISLVAMLLVQARYAFDTFVFFGVATVSYMFKDRIKDWLKKFFTSAMAGWLTDHSVGIVDPAFGDEIGRFREAVSFIPAEAVPDEVLGARRGLALDGEEGVKEVTLKYVKKVKLNPERIFQHHHRLASINDILRFSVAEFLGRMDDPRQSYVYFDRTSDELRSAAIVRTYPVDVVFRLSARRSGGLETHLEAVRLVLTRVGIHRLERPRGRPSESEIPD